jgi:hypothetical protein
MPDVRHTRITRAPMPLRMVTPAHAAQVFY